MGRKRNKKRWRSKSKADKERIREVLRKQQIIMKKGDILGISEGLVSSKNLSIDLGKRLHRERSRETKRSKREREEQASQLEISDHSDHESELDMDDQCPNGDSDQNRNFPKGKDRTVELNGSLGIDGKTDLKRIKTEDEPPTIAVTPRVNLFAVKSFKVDKDEQKRIEEETKFKIPEVEPKATTPANVPELDIRNPFNKENEEFMENKNHIIKATGFNGKFSDFQIINIYLI